MNLEKFITKEELYENNFDELLLKKGLILPYYNQNRTTEDMKNIFKISLENRENTLKELNKYFKEDTYVFKDYTYKIKYIKETLLKYDDTFDKFISTLVEIEKILIEYDEKILDLKK